MLVQVVRMKRRIEDFFEAIGEDKIKCKSYCGERLASIDSEGNSVCDALGAPTRGGGVVGRGTPYDSERICIMGPEDNTSD